MLQNPARPSGNVQLPYTTADMAERLAKRKAEKDRQDILDSLQGGLSYGKSGVDITPLLSQVGGMAKNLALTAPGTVADMVPYVANIPYIKGSGAWGYEPEDAGTSNFFQAGGQGLEQAGRRAVGDITAIPRVGKPSASPTATDIKRLGVIEGLSKAGIDYGNLALTAAPFVKPSAFGISNAYQDMVQARIARQNAPAYRYTGDFIDMVEGPNGVLRAARTVDTPATPATRLAEAQTQRALTPAQVAPIEVAPRAPLPWVTNALPNSRIVKYTEPVLDKYGTRIRNGADITLRSLKNKSSYEMMDGVMRILIDYKTQTATLEMMGVANEFVTPQLAAAALAELSAFDFLKTKYPLIPSRNIPRPLIEQLQRAGLIDPNYEIPAPGPQNMNDIVQRPLTLASDRPFDNEVIPQNYQSYYDSIIESMFPQKVIEPNFVIDSDNAAHYFIVNGGALDQVPPQYLWQVVENNSTNSLPIARFQQIGSAGGHIGMDRYVDKATGQHFGLKYSPGRRFLFKNPTRQSNGFYTSTFDGPLGEILSDEIAVALGFPSMNLRLIVNGDETVSIITDLAQDVYGGKIIDSHEAGLPPNANAPSSSAPANFVPVEDRIRMAVLDLLIDNGDRNTSNVLFSVDETGKVRLVPIDHEITFFPARDLGIGYPAAMNFSVRLAYKDDPTKLFETIKATITKIQEDLQNSQIVKRFKSKLFVTTKKVGIDFTDLNAADKWDFDNQIQAFENKVKAYLSADPKELAEKYIKQIEEYKP